MINPYPPSRGQWVPLPPNAKRVTRSGKPIAPGYTDVYLNLDMSSTLEAVAKDSKGRTITTPFRTSKSMMKSAKVKFKRISKWDSAYPAIMARIQKHLHKSEEAKVIYLIDKTHFRVGGEKDTKAEKKAFGATTLLPEHVSVEGDKTTFNFPGKRGVQFQRVVEDAYLAKLVHERINQPKLFNTDRNKVLRYLRSLPRAKDFKTHDFRAHFATSLAKERIAELPAPTTHKELKQAKMIVATEASQGLGNKPSEALKSYIDPRVWEDWESELPPIVKRKTKKRRR